MNQDSMLRDRVTQSLGRHPQISHYMGEQLRRRLVASSDWLVNPLLHALATLPGQLNTERMLQHLVGQLPNAQCILESIFAEVKCDDEGDTFDERLADALAELHLLNYLAQAAITSMITAIIEDFNKNPNPREVDMAQEYGFHDQENGFHDIVRPSTKKMRTPDFTASKNSITYYAEAKRLHDREWIFSLANRYLQAASIRHPELGAGSMSVGRSQQYSDEVQSGDVPRPDGKKGREIRQCLEQELGSEGAFASLSAMRASHPTGLIIGDGYVALNFTPAPPGGLSVVAGMTFTSMDAVALEYITLLARILGKISEALHQCLEFARSEGSSPHYLVFLALDVSPNVPAPHTRFWRNLIEALKREVGNLSINDPYGPRIPCAVVLHSPLGEEMVCNFRTGA